MTWKNSAPGERGTIKHVGLPNLLPWLPTASAARDEITKPSTEGATERVQTNFSPSKPARPPASIKSRAFGGPSFDGFGDFRRRAGRGCRQPWQQIREGRRADGPSSPGADSSKLSPAPIFFCKGKRRLEASTIRSALACFDALRTAARVMTSLSSQKPGFTPVPTNATPLSWRICRAASRVPGKCGTGKRVPRKWTQRKSRRPCTQALIHTFGREDEWRASPRPRTVPALLWRRRKPSRPGRIGRADYLAQILPIFCRVVINGPIISMASFSRISFRIEAPIGRFHIESHEFLFHDRLQSTGLKARTARKISASESIRRTGNCKRVQSSPLFAQC